MYTHRALRLVPLHCCAVAATLGLVEFAAISAAHAETKTAVVVQAPVAIADQEATDFLVGRLGPSTVVRTSSQALQLPRDFRIAAESWRCPIVVFMSAAMGRIHAWRKKDGVVIARDLEAAHQYVTPYAMALAASELVELLEGRPQVIVKTPPASTATTAPEGWRLTLQVGAGLSLITSPDGIGAMVQPTFDLGVRLGRQESMWFGGLAFRLAVLGEQTSDAPVPGTRIRYRRNDGELRVLLGLQSDRAHVALEGLGGASLNNVDAVAIRNDEILERAQRLVPWGGAGLSASYSIAFGFGLSLDSHLIGIFRPARYLVQGEAGLEEGLVRWRAALSLFWRG